MTRYLGRIRDLKRVVDEVAQLYPDAVLARNEVGNVVFGNEGEPPTGYIDLMAGGYGLFDPEA